MKALKLNLKFVKSTKGTHVFGDEADSAPIRQVYIQRAAIEGEPPSAITLTVEVAK